MVVSQLKPQKQEYGADLLLRVSRLLVKPLNKVQRRLDISLKVLKQPIRALLQNRLQLRIMHCIQGQHINLDRLTDLLEPIPQLLGLLPIKQVAHPADKLGTGICALKLGNRFLEDVWATAGEDDFGGTGCAKVAGDGVADARGGATDEDCFSRLGEIRSEGGDGLVGLSAFGLRC